MRGLILLADGFEDTEALSTRDVLIRGGIEVVTSSISDSRQVLSSFGLTLLADTLIEKISPKDFDFLVLPGGGRGTENLRKNSHVTKLILEFKRENKLIAAICAAPSILGGLGLLKDHRFTCFAGCEVGYEGIFTGEEVEIDGNFITARSMKYSIPFALAIIEKLIGENAKERVLIGLKGLNAK